MKKRALIIGEDPGALLAEHLATQSWVTAVLPDRATAMALVQEFNPTCILLAADLSRPEPFLDLSGLLQDPTTSRIAVIVATSSFEAGPCIEVLSMGALHVLAQDAEPNVLDAEMTEILTDAMPSTAGAQGAKCTGKGTLRKLNRFARSCKTTCRVVVEGLSLPAQIVFQAGVCTNALFRGASGKAALAAMLNEAGNGRLKFVVEGYVAPHQATLVGGGPSFDGSNTASVLDDTFAAEAAAALEGWGFEDFAGVTAFGPANDSAAPEFGSVTDESGSDSVNPDLMGEDSIDDALLFFAPTSSATANENPDLPRDEIHAKTSESYLDIDDSGEDAAASDEVDFNSDFTTDSQSGSFDEGDFELPPSFQEPSKDDSLPPDLAFSDSDDFIDISVEVKARQGEKEARLPAPSLAQINALPALRVIVIEGNTDDAASTQAVFRSQGWQVYCVPDGLVGANEVIKHRPDVVVASTQAPKLDGWGITAAIRGDFRTRETTIILNGAAGNLLNQLRLLDVGANGYMESESGKQVLVAHIQDLVTPRRNMIAALEPGLAFSGQVAATGIAFILRAIAEKGVTGLLTVTHRYGVSRVDHHDGVITSVDLASASGKVVGEDAIRTLLLIDDGPFQFDPARHIGPASTSIRFTQAADAIAMQLNAAKRDEESAKIASGRVVRGLSDALAQFYLLTCPQTVRQVASHLLDGISPQVLVTQGANPKLLEAVLRDMLRKRVVEHIDDAVSFSLGF